MRRALGLAFALVVLTATPALAHVSVTPDEVSEGSFATLTFRVPNESDTASTSAFEIVLPETAPFTSVSVKPAPGWETTVERDGDTVTSILWDGGEIGPGEFQEFDVSVGPVPEVDVLEFKALQTYDDGEVVRWIDPVVEGEDEPDNPAPTASVVSGESDDDGHGETTAADDDGEHGTDPAEFAALLLAGLAVVAAVAALIFATKRAPA